MREVFHQAVSSGASVVAQWVGTRLLVQETQVRSLVWEDLTKVEQQTKSMRRAATPEPLL